MEQLPRGSLATLLPRPRLIIIGGSEERPPYGGEPCLKGPASQLVDIGGAKIAARGVNSRESYSGRSGIQPWPRRIAC